MVATGPKSSKTATNEYQISIEGNPYPHTLALINPAGDNLNIKKHGFTGPLGQLLSLKYTVYDDANEKLFTVVDGGFSNMPRVALIIEHEEVAVFDYGLNRLEMKCVTNIPNYTIPHMTESEIEKGFHLEWATAQEIIDGNEPFCETQPWSFRDREFVKMLVEKKILTT